MQHNMENAVVLRAMVPLISDDAVNAWVHAARFGEYKGHRSGGFQFTREVFDQIKRNFEGQRNQVVPLTWEHPFYDGSVPIEKAGWVHRLEVRDDGLWALCEFSDRAVELNRKGSYRFASVVVVFDAVHRETGEEIGAELLELALTDSPYIDGLTPTFLSRHEEPTLEERWARLTADERVRAETQFKHARLDLDAARVAYLKRKGAR